MSFVLDGWTTCPSGSEQQDGGILSCDISTAAALVKALPASGAKSVTFQYVQNKRNIHDGLEQQSI
jgi:hypothetical protein